MKGVDSMCGVEGCSPVKLGHPQANLWWCVCVCVVAACSISLPQWEQI